MGIMLQLPDGTPRAFSLSTNTAYTLMMPIPDPDGVYTLTMEGFDGSGGNVTYNTFQVETSEGQAYAVWVTGILAAPARPKPYLGIFKSQSVIYGEKVYDMLKVYVRPEGYNCGTSGSSAKVPATVVINNGSADQEDFEPTQGQTTLVLNSQPSSVMVFLNEIFQDSSKYTYGAGTINYTGGFDAGDKVTVIKLP